MMKILCFHPALAPYRVDFFNLLADRISLKLVLMLDNLRTQRFNQTKLKERLKIPVVHARKISFLTRDIPLGCVGEVRLMRPDVVLTYECSPVTLIMILMRMLLGGNFTLWTSFDDSEDLIVKRSGLRKWIRDFVMRQVDGIVVPSRLAEGTYRRSVTGIERLKFAVVPIIHDVDVVRTNVKSVFHSAAMWRKENLQKGEKMALFVGRLTAVKNLEWLIDRVMDGRWPECLKLFIVGDGDLRDKLVGRVSESELFNRVLFLGRKEGTDLQSFFAAADFLVLPSKTEPFGAVVSEALQWGVPVLVSSRVGAKALIGAKRCGEVFNFDDERDFYSKLNDLVKGCSAWRAGRPSLELIHLSEYIDEFLEKMK